MQGHVHSFWCLLSLCISRELNCFCTKVLLQPDTEQLLLLTLWPKEWETWLWNLSKNGKTFPIHYFLHNQSQFKIPKWFKEDNSEQGIPEHLLLRKCVLKQAATTEPPPMHPMCSEQLISRPITKLCCSGAVAAVWWGLQEHNFAPESPKFHLASCWVANPVLNCCRVQLMVRRLQESPPVRAALKHTEILNYLSCCFQEIKWGRNNGLQYHNCFSRKANIRTPI